MSRNSIKYFRPEEGGMDEIIRILEEEKGVGRRDNDNTYHFDVCTFRVDRRNNKIEVEGNLFTTINYSVSQLKGKADVKLEEIIENGNKKSE